MPDLKKKARLAGILGLLMGLPLPFSLLFVPSKIMVPNNASVTANNLLAHEELFRVAILSHLYSATMFLVVALALYRLLSRVNKGLAQLMVVFVVAQVPISFAIETLNLSSLMLLKGNVLSSMSLQERQELSFLLLKMARFGISIQQLFWGVWLLPYGLLVCRSVFIPRFLGILLIINGIGCIVECISFLLLQNQHYLLVRRFTFPTSFGELFMLLWLVIKGVKNIGRPTAGMKTAATISN